MFRRKYCWGFFAYGMKRPAHGGYISQVQTQTKIFWATFPPSTDQYGCWRSKLYQSPQKVCPDPVGFPSKERSQEVGSSKFRDGACGSVLVTAKGCQGNVTNLPMCKESGSLGRHPASLENLLHGNGSMITDVQLGGLWQKKKKKNKNNLQLCLLLVWTLGQKYPPPPTLFFLLSFYYYFFLTLEKF